jgi:uncharacterized protein (DUF1697 family)
LKIYIALLRAINVGGNNKILMKDLRLLLEDLGLENVKTYIQSGNIIFKSDKNRKQLESLISKKINEVYGFEIPVIILTKNELKIINQNNLFLEDETVNQKSLYVAYLNQIPKDTKKLDDFDFGLDEFIHKGKTIYLKYDLGAGKTKLSNGIIENKLQVKSTCRNWRTTCKLLDLALEF